MDDMLLYFEKLKLIHLTFSFDVNLTQYKRTFCHDLDNDPDPWEPQDKMTGTIAAIYNSFSSLDLKKILLIDPCLKQNSVC